MGPRIRAKNTFILPVAALAALLITDNVYARSTSHLEFLVEPSARGAAGVRLVRQPVAWGVDENGSPNFKPLKRLTLGAYLDPSCSVPASGNVLGRDIDYLASFGFAVFRDVGYPSAGTIYLKLSAAGVGAECSSAIHISPTAPRHQLAIVAGDGQSGLVNAALAVAPQVKVLDGKGRGIAGVKISFTAGGSGGKVSSSSVTTDSSGLASTQFILGGAAGAYTLVAQRHTRDSDEEADEESSRHEDSDEARWSVTFHETATSPSAVGLALKGPSSQVAGSCSLAFNVISVDQNGNPTSVSQATPVAMNGLGKAAIFGDSNCGAALSSVVIPAGSSSQTFYLSDTRAESLNISATGTGLTASVSISDGISPGAPVSLGFATLPSDQAIAGQAFLVQPAIRVLDAFGNAVRTGSAAITLSASSDAACLNAATGKMGILTNPQSSASGTATFSGVSYTTAGQVYLKAAADGLTLACSRAITVSAGGPDHLVISSGDAQSGAVGSILASTAKVQVVDAYSNAVSGVKLAVGVVQGGGSVSAALATTDAAGMASAQMTLGQTPGGNSFSFKAQDSTWTGTPTSVTFNANAVSGAPVALTLTGPVAQTAGNCSTALTIGLKDTYGNPTTANTSISVGLAGSSQGGFFADSSCSQAVSSLGISTGNGNQLFYFLDTRAEQLTFTVSGAGLSSASSPIAVSPGAASRLGLSSQPSSGAMAGQVFSTQPGVQVLDSFGNPVNSAGGSVTLAAYSDSSCTAPATGALSAAGNPLSFSSGTALFAGVSYSRSGALYLGVAVPGLTSACSQAIGVTPAAADHLVQLEGDGQSATVGTAVPVSPKVRAVDAYGNPVSGFGLAFFVAAGGGTVSAASASTDASGQASVAFTLGGLVGQNSLKVQSAGPALPGSPSSLTFNATATADSPSALALSGPPSSVAGGCSSALTVSLKDRFGNPTLATADVAVSVSGLGSGSLFSDASCSAVASAVTIASSTSSKIFYAKDNRAESLLLSAASTGLTSVSLPYTVQAASPAVIAISTQPSSSSNADQLLAIQPAAQIKDSYGNVANSASGSVTLAAFLDAGCTNPASGTLSVAQNPLAVLGGSVTFSGVGYTMTGTIYLGMSSSGLASACSASIVISAGVLDHLIALEGNAQSAIAGSILPINPRVKAVDVYSNAVPGASVSFAVISGGGAVGSSPVSTDASGQASSTFTLGSSPGANSMSASATLGAGSRAPGSVTSVSFSATGTPRPPQRLVLTGDAAISAGACSNPYTIQALDDHGSTTVVASSTAVSLSGVGSGFFYSDAGCSLKVSSATITQGGGSAQVYFADRVSESVTLVAQAPGLASGSASVSISAGAATGLVFSVPPSSNAKAGTVLASQPGVLAQDAFGNQATAFVGAVTLAAYSDAACSSAAGSAISATTNPLNATSGQAVFAGVSYPLASTIYLSASSTGLTSICSGPITVTSALDLAMGSNHTCVLRNGGVQCFGAGVAGSLGNGASSNMSAAVQVQGLASGVIAVGAGGQHSCAALSGGGIKCWGMNFYGELGNGLTANSNVPVDVVGISGEVQQIVGGDSHTCVLQNGAVLCWGSNSFGQLGTGNAADSHVPVAVQGMSSGVISIASSSASTCSLLLNGTAYCWGYNDFGQLGNGTTTNSNVPVQVQGLNGIKTIATGVEHACALLDSGVQCWGHNSNGQLGNGTYNDSLFPVPVQGMGAGVEKLLSGGMNFNCAITQSGAAMCWGQNSRGQLGDNRNSGSTSNVPVPVQGMSAGVQLLKSGFLHACAADASGLRCWGWGRSGQLGNGSFTESYVPVSVIGY